MDYIKSIAEAVKFALHSMLVDTDSDFTVDVESPSDRSNGDYSTNVALKNFKRISAVLKPEFSEVKDPYSLAVKLSEVLSSDKDLSYISKVEAARPGFVNFYLSQSYLAENTINSILEGDLVKIPRANSGKKVIVEHTAVNPNKAMHIGHLRNAFIGDMVANMYRRVGYKVEVHNYIDDTGVQVADTVNALVSLGHVQSKDQLFDDFCWDIYAEINSLYSAGDESLLSRKKEIMHELEKGEGDFAKKATEAVDKIVRHHVELMETFGIRYDLLVFESDILKLKFWDYAFSQLKKSDKFYLEAEGKQAGCWVLKYKNQKYGNKIFVRADGTLVYTAKDTAYHMWKFGLLGLDFNYKEFKYADGLKSVMRTSSDDTDLHDGFGCADKIVTVVDERQSYPQEMVRHALETLGYKKEYENYKHLAYGVVNISADTASKIGIKTDDSKNSYAMSGRKGVGVKARDLLDLITSEVYRERSGQKLENDTVLHIASGTLKHYMLKYNPQSEIVFDYKSAMQLTGNTGPYLQYSYSRAVKILQKAGVSSSSIEDLQSIQCDYDNIVESEVRLVSTMSKWPEVLDESVNSLVVSYISDYAFNLATAFHKFYEEVRVITEENESRKNALLRLVTAYSFLLKDVLSIMGIDVVDDM